MKKNIQLYQIIYFLLLFSSLIQFISADNNSDQCYLGCATCSQNNSPNSCITCYKGRGETILNQSIYNSCPCFGDYEETLDQDCQPKSSSYKAINVIMSIFVIILIILLVLLAASGHHLLTFIIFDNFQLIGYLRIINIPLTGIMDTVLGTLQNLNLGILFGRTLNYQQNLLLSNGQYSPVQILNVPDQNITSPAQLPLMGFSYSFLYNMMSLLILYIVIGSIISFFVIIQKCKRYKSGLIFLVNQKRYTTIVRLITITICEVIFYALLQLQKISFSNSFNQFSFALTIIALIGLAVLVFFLIFAINWTIQVQEMSNPKYNTYFDRLKRKTLVNKNLICIQLFVKLIFISFVVVGITQPETSLMILLILYVAYSILVAVCISLTKARIYIAYILLTILVIISIILVGIYKILGSNIDSNKNGLLIISWFFAIFIMISVISCVIYATAELISVLPDLLNNLRQAWNYLNNHEEVVEDDENIQNQQNTKDISNNLEFSLVTKRKLATKNKKQSVNHIFQGINNQTQTAQWYDNPLNSKQQNEIDQIQQSFQQQINFELNEKQRGSMIQSRISANNEFNINNNDL
ncbi:transmembrane protein, putative (macronuclear) [Tetrahymena thermophila SB210]|uniref:Transmembrane protein, putative n=1 Tax=Tetrahymena thermophila (strain SB210) TaxID=312017 RepID=W7XJF7_TETTS|nr:transmembrane protein, putative [Tetrahymena thermophila SB210]EWS75481.1 transmembrane protein, putative [Tetrahymena thermophila SB210]|eukprot:XP_012651950.1 transmembrane protein, putative [Tetrahymena thermophila SB210]